MIYWSHGKSPWLYVLYYERREYCGGWRYRVCLAGKTEIKLTPCGQTELQEFTRYILKASILHTRYAKKLEPNLYPLKRFIYPLIELLVVTILFYMFEETFVIRWVIMIIYILAMFYKERNRLKVYFPNMSFWK